MKSIILIVGIVLLKIFPAQAQMRAEKYQPHAVDSSRTVERKVTRAKGADSSALHKILNDVRSGKLKAVVPEFAPVDAEILNKRKLANRLPDGAGRPMKVSRQQLPKDSVPVIHQGINDKWKKSKQKD